ncbi:MAG: VWA domain-containing protein [Tepidisphaeraceae bacterium]
MQWTGWPTASIVTIASAAAALLVVLHLLRVRPRRQTVRTLLFWNEALGEPVANRLFGRFHHWRTFLLLLCIAGLLSVALARPTWSTPQARTVVVIDAGLSMKAKSSRTGSRFDEARRRADEVIATARGQVAVIAAESAPRLVSNFDDPRAVQRSNVASLVASTGSPASRDALRLAQNLIEPGQPGRIVWCTDQATLPDGVGARGDISIDRQDLAAADADRAILWAGLEPAPDGWRVRVRVGRYGTVGAADIVMRVNDRVVAKQPLEIDGRDETDLILPIGPINADAVDVKLEGATGLPDNDSVRLTTQPAPAIVVRWTGDIPQPLRSAVDAAVMAGRDSNARATTQASDPATSPHELNLTDRAEVTAASIVVVRSEAIADSMPQPVKAVGDSTLTAGLDFEDGVAAAGAGLARSDALEPLLSSGDAILAARSRTGPRCVYLSDALLKPECTAWRRAAFPIFIARAVQYVTDTTPASQSTVVGDRATGERIAAAGRSTSSPVSSADSRSWPQPYVLCLLAALALMLMEAWLSAKGKVV